MFKKYFLISILLCIPSLSYAQSFPRPPYDGRFNDAIIESLRNKIDNDRIGKNNGVAGLDNNGNIPDNIGRSSSNMITTGTTFSDANIIKTHYTDVTNNTNISGLKLPNSKIGQAFTVFNRGNNNLQIYPNNINSQIENYGNGIPFILNINSSVTFVYISNNLWRIL